MKIALVSLNQAWEDKAENRCRCEKAVVIAANAGADAAVFPEMTLTGFSMNTAAIAENPDDSPSLAFYSDLARTKRIWVLAGIVVQHNKKAQNRFVCFDREGHMAASYAKIHPFSFAGEDDYYDGGNELITLGIEGWEVGLSVCYDLRFAEFYAALGRRSQLLVNIANWPAKRQEHWRVLLQARAIETQCFVAGVNRTGVDGNGHVYEESSMLFAPDGTTVLPETVCDSKVQVFTLKHEILESLQRGFSSRQDARPNLYREWL